MASTQIVPLNKAKKLGIVKSTTVKQIQIEMLNGRRFVLTGSDQLNDSDLEYAMVLINQDNCVNLEEWTEKPPAPNSPAAIALTQRISA